jgi:hypothetical protein
MRFRAMTPDSVFPLAVDRAYIAGIEAIPWYGRNVWSQGVLTIERGVSESGNLHIPWNVPGHGQPVLSTCTLMERQEPYVLELELARGTLHRARALVAELRTEGVSLPDSITADLARAVTSFIRTATDRTAAIEDAQLTIRLSCDAIASLFHVTLPGRLVAQCAKTGPLPTLLVGRLGNQPLNSVEAEAFVASFHAASLPCRWRDLTPTPNEFRKDLLEQQLAWCEERDLRVLGGPLIQLDRESLPEWVLDLGQYDTFENAARGHVRQVLEYCHDAVDVWVCAGRLNVDGATRFSEEQRLRLAVATIETVHESSPRAPVVISFDQPWAEYLATNDYDLSPLHFADALVRAELGVGGVALEVNLGYWPDGSLPRDFLAISRHLDRWSLLGIPLIVYLTLPSQPDPDPHAVGSAQVVLAERQAGQELAMDQRLVEFIIPLLCSKPAVHAVVWNQWSDREPHEFPHSGLVDSLGQLKPTASLFTRFRQSLLS